MSAVVALSGGVDPLGTPAIRLSTTGTLSVIGSSRKEFITIQSRPNGNIAVDFVRKYSGGQRFAYTAQYDAQDVKRLNLSGGSGDDTIKVLVDVRGSSEIFGGRGNDTLSTTGKRTYINGGFGDDTLISDAPASEVTPIAMAVPTTPPDPIRVINATYNLLTDVHGADTFRSRGGEDAIFGNGSNDRFVPLEAGIDRVDRLTTLQHMSDTFYTSSRLQIYSVGLIGRDPVGAKPIHVNYGSLSERTFQVISE